MARMIDADALQIEIASLSRMARSYAQKSLMWRVLYIIDQMPTASLPTGCRYADANGVCSKLSGNGVINYCVEGMCPYLFDEEVRDDGKSKLD